MAVREFDKGESMIAKCLGQSISETPALAEALCYRVVSVYQKFKLVGLRVGDAEDKTKWRQMNCCGDPWREKPKEKKNRLSKVHQQKNDGEPVTG